MTDIFVFGSNLLGIHKRGAALTALEKHGATLGAGMGLQGNSYAIPTKRTPSISLDLVSINRFVASFMTYAKYTPENMYHVTKIGCGLAGHLPEQIAPMFRLVKELNNIKLDREFVELIPELAMRDEFITTFSVF